MGSGGSVPNKPLMGPKVREEFAPETCDHTCPIQNTKPLRTPKYTPKYTPNPPPKPRNTEKIRRKIYEKIGDFRIFFVVFFLYFSVLEGDLGVYFGGVHFGVRRGFIFCLWGVYPLTRNYCENNSLRIIFRNF